VKNILFFVFFIVFNLSISVANAVSLDACDLDLDGNGQTDALTDGILLVRHLFGFTGDTLTDGALGTSATRTADEITQVLNAEACQLLTDLDGNGQIDALTDGVILVRFLFGYTGSDMTLGALADDASRTGFDVMTEHVNFYSAIRELIASGQVTSDTLLSDAWGDIVVQLQDANDLPANISIIKNQDGNSLLIEVNGGLVSIQLPDPNLPDESNNRVRRSIQNNVRCEGDSPTNSFLNIQLMQTCAWYVGLPFSVGSHRLPGDGRTLSSGLSSMYALSKRISSKLTGACLFYDRDCIDNLGSPVLFIHGYTQGDAIGGGDPTWKDFPQLIKESGYNPFEFQWNTNARFQDIANELLIAIDYISFITGKKVQIVAHSFGGVLTRTLLQEIGTNPSYNIASVTTIGTPHSGIMDGGILNSNQNQVNNIYLPMGQDFKTLFDGCGQISCYQMGETITNLGSRTTMFGIDSENGHHAAELYNTIENLPLVDIQVLIGLSPGISYDWDYGLYSYTQATGDNLISFRGQLFTPERSGVELNYFGTYEYALKNFEFGSASIYEKYLGNGQDVVEYHDVPQNEISVLGYSHSHSEPLHIDYHNILGFPISNKHVGLAESYVERCGVAQACYNHDSFVKVKAWLDSHTADPIPNTCSLETRSINTRNALSCREQLVLNLQVNANDTAIPNAVITVGLSTGWPAMSASATTDTNGLATLNFDFVANQTYTLMINAPGYRTANYPISTYTTVSGTNTDINITLVPDTATPVRSELALTIKNAINGQVVADARFEVRRVDQQTLIQSGLTDGSGETGGLSLLPGDYEIKITKDGYENMLRQISIGADNISQILAISPILVGDGTTRIVLTWDVNPRDLDSHLIKYDSSGTEIYHIYYGDSNDATTQDNLDLDDTSSYGPETITIQDLDPTARYVYAVHHFSGSGSISSTSDARVSIVLGDGSQRVYNTPTTGDGRYWKVLEINNGVIEPCSGSECIMDSGATSYTRSRRNATDPEWLEEIKSNIKEK